MRRSMVSMLVTLGALSTPLGAQAVDSGGAAPGAALGAGNAVAVGFTTTIGAGWQIQAGEIAYVRRVGLGPVRAVSAGVRLGSFVDEGAIIGGSRGFVAAGTLGLRTGRAVFAEMGDDISTTNVAVDLSVEATGYLAANSPLLVGSRWFAVSFLPGLRAFGSAGGPEYSLVVGPTVFIGTETEVRAFLAFRVDIPLARREAHP